MIIGGNNAVARSAGALVDNAAPSLEQALETHASYRVLAQDSSTMFQFIVGPWNDYKGSARAMLKAHGAYTQQSTQRAAEAVVAAADDYTRSAEHLLEHLETARELLDHALISTNLAQGTHAFGTHRYVIEGGIRSLGTPTADFAAVRSAWSRDSLTPRSTDLARIRDAAEETAFPVGGGLTYLVNRTTGTTLDRAARYALTEEALALDVALLADADPVIAARALTSQVADLASRAAAAVDALERVDGRLGRGPRTRTAAQRERLQEALDLSHAHAEELRFKAGPIGARQAFSDAWGRRDTTEGTMHSMSVGISSAASNVANPTSRRLQRTDHDRLIKLLRGSAHWLASARDHLITVERAPR